MLHLRTATEEDTKGIQALIAEVYAEYDCVLDVERDEPHLLAPANYFRRSGGELWVVDEQGLVRASAGVLLHKDAGELKALYVHPTLRRQGWGRRLVELAIEHARRASKPRMILWSDTRFLDAHRLYLSMGFRQTGVRELQDCNNSVEFGFELP